VPRDNIHCCAGINFATLLILYGTLIGMKKNADKAMLNKVII
jgi:hypothetical protein